MRSPSDRPGSWEALRLEDLVFAYRKAKVDCFYERAVSQRLAFAKYEENLQENLSGLLGRLRSDSSREELFDDERLMGEWHLVPKKLEYVQDDGPTPGEEASVFFSDKERAFRVQSSRRTIQPHCRLTSRFAVDLHVLSSLWVNLVGHRLDECLDATAYGARLRRTRRPDGTGQYSLRAQGSFEPFVRPYRRWREEGILAMRRALEDGRKILALTMDFSSYFHKIDPIFATSDGFYEAVRQGAATETGRSLEGNRFAHEFTAALVGFFKRWGSEMLKQGRWTSDAVAIGLPIAVSAARVLANVLLAPWDRAVQKGLAPIHYGRYVDDLLVVLQDPGDLESEVDVMRFLGHRLPNGMLQSGSSEGFEWTVQLGEWQGKTELKLQRKKQRLFFLSGQGGLDLLEVIERDVRELSSERRMMPDPETLASKPPSRLLATTADPGETPDSLRRSDGLSVRRLEWSIRLGHAETLRDDLPASEWEKERHALFGFAKDHIITPERFYDYWDCLPRLVSLAVACQDFRWACELVREAIAVLEALSGGQGKEGPAPVGNVNGFKCDFDHDLLRRTLDHQAREAVAAAWPKEVVETGEAAHELLSLVGPALPDWLIVELSHVDAAWKLFRSDLALHPWKRDLGGEDGHGALGSGPRMSQEIECCFESEDREAARAFWRRVSHGETEVIPTALFFPTRPLTPGELSELDPQCFVAGKGKSGSEPQAHWSALLRVLCGYSLLEEPETGRSDRGARRATRDCVRVGRDREEWIPKLGVSNFLVGTECWSAAAAGQPVLSKERYARMAGIVNQALRASPRPDYLLLPELSLPLRWRHSVANRLLSAGINLVAGLEYEAVKGTGVRNQAFLALNDDRFGFPVWVFLRQEKQGPAAHEEEELLRLHGKSLVSPCQHAKRIYRHRGLQFGVLLCSELQDIERRASFRGKVDALLVLSWNQDLDTFSSLVESAALDVHAYIALANNRRYGDSRLRGPAKERYSRDLCRVLGGRNDYLVVAELDYKLLRQFQSRAKPWPGQDDPFKPVPPGFNIDPSRREIP